jgi:FkbM family methyltransferase
MKPSLLQTMAAWVGSTVGRERAIVRALRPTYEHLLDRASRGRGYLVTINGTDQFYVNPRYRAWFGETYEPEAFAYLKAHVRSGATILNVGAHVGIYALSMASWVGRSGRVFAFEPNPETRQILTDQIARNDCADRVTIVPGAVADKAGSRLFSASGAAGFSRLGAANPARDDVHEAFPVEVTTIDTFCAERGVVPDWITLDVEGYEVSALEGARETIMSRRAALTLTVEMHPSLWPLSGASRDSMQKLLDALQLHVEPLTGQRDPFAENGVVALSTRSPTLAL